jgi:tetratricopeptide (TPR) repeat protein
MRALPHLWAHRESDNARAIDHLAQALALEPGYGLAAALAAWAHGQQVAYSWSRDIAADRAEGERMVEQAALTVADQPTALTALAAAIMQLGGDVPQALRFIDKALEIDPNHAWAWMRRGFGLVYTGTPDAAIEAFATARRLSPLDPFGFNVNIGTALARFSAGRHQEAIQLVRGVLAERPGLTWPYRDLAVYYAHHGDLAAARDALDKFLELRPAMTLASLGDSLRFMEPGLLSAYLRGLKLAGLP